MVAYAEFFILHKTLTNYLQPQPLLYGLLLIVATGFCTVQAQQPAFAKTALTYELEYIPMPEQNGKFSVTNMAEDTMGFIWLATNCGLVCWDGQKTIAYSAGNNWFKLPLQENSFYNFVTDKAGLIYNCQDGYNQFDPYRRSFKKLSGLPPQNKTGREYEKYLFDDNGQLYIVAYYEPNQQATLFKQMGNVYKPILTRSFESRRDKFDFVPADNKFIYWKKDSIFVHDNQGRLLKKIHLAGSSFNAWSAYHSARYAAVFFENSSKKIFAFNKHSLNMEVLANLSFLPVNTVNKIAITDSLIWIAGNQQLYQVNLAAHTYQDLSVELFELIKMYYPLNLSTSGANVFVCRNGNIFLWTENMVIRLRKKQPLTESFKETVIDQQHKTSLSFRALAEDDAKNIYASYYTGIAKQTAGKGPFKWLDFPLHRSLKEEGVYGLQYYHNTLYWNNVKLQLPGLSTAFISGNNFAGHSTLLKDGDSIWYYSWLQNKLYIAPLGTGSARQVADFTQQGIDNMTGLVADPDGKHLWYSSGHFITKINKKGTVVKSWTRGEINQLYDQVHCLFIKNNYLWFGCNQGLGTVDLKTYQVKQYKNPVVNTAGNLNDVVVFSMLPYHDSLILLGTNRGIYLFNIQQYTWYNLDKNHPLAQIEFNRSSTLLASNGKCYFGSIDGLYSFFPDQLAFTKSAKINLSIQLVNISWYHQDKQQPMYQWQNLSKLTSFTLAPFASNLELLFSVQDFEQTIFYSYRIAGYNDVWQEYNTTGKITIGSLIPGNYSIQVKAATAVSDKNPVYYTLQLTVQEQWYKKWWVRALFFLLIAGFIWWFLKRQIQTRLAQQHQKLERQKELEALRIKISSDLHDDVGSILSGLSMQSQNIALHADEKTKDELYEIADMSREAMERMRDTVWAIDSRKDKYINLVDRMRSFAEQQLSAKNISHRFDVDIADPEAFIDPVKRQNIYLIFKELITNIIKHSNATEIILRFTHRHNNTYLLVHDNGTLQKEKKTDGMGMSNIALRTKHISATFRSTYENGFKAELVIDD